MSTETKTTLNWIDNARVVASFAVVLLHVAAGIVIESDLTSQEWLTGNVFLSLVRWVVPVFVMISGVLLLDPERKETPLEFYRKRVSRIFIPLVFWTLFFVGWAILKKTWADEPLSLAVFEPLLYGKPYYHMWFMFMIVGLYLFAPLFKIILSRIRQKAAILFVSILFILAMANAAYNGLVTKERVIFLYLFVPFIPYFFAGRVLQNRPFASSSAVLWALFIASALLTAVGSYTLSTRLGLGMGEYFYNPLSITVIPMSLSAFFLFMKWERPLFNSAIIRKVSELTLGVYLIHPIVLNIIKLFVFDVWDLDPLLYIPLLSLLSYMATLLIAWVIKKIPYLRNTI